MLLTLLVLAVLHAIASLILGHRLATAVRAIKAKGEPVSVAQLGGPPVPVAENAAVEYEKVFRWLTASENGRTLNVLGSVPYKADTNRVWRPDGTPPQRVLLPEAADRPTFWAEATQAAAASDDIIPLVRRAAMMPRCRFEVRWQDGWDTQFAHLARIRDLVKLLCARAVVKARVGNTSEAYESAVLALKLSRSVPNDPSLLVVLIQCGCTRDATDALLEVLTHGTPSRSHARSLYDLLASIDHGPAYVAATKGDRALGLWAVEFTRREGYPAALGFSAVSLKLGDADPQRGPMYRCLAVLTRPLLYADALVFLRHSERAIAAAPQPYRCAVYRELDKDALRLPPYAILTRLGGPDIAPHCRRSVDTARAVSALAQVVLAAQQYKAAQGSYPTSLEALRRDGWKLPEDPFSGKDLVYKPAGQGFQVYSIGANLRDDHGAATGDVYREDGSDRVLFWRH